MLDRVDQ